MMALSNIFLNIPLPGWSPYPFADPYPRLIQNNSVLCGNPHINNQLDPFRCLATNKPTLQIDAHTTHSLSQTMAVMIG